MGPHGKSSLRAHIVSIILAATTASGVALGFRSFPAHSVSKTRVNALVLGIQGAQSAALGPRFRGDEGPEVCEKTKKPHADMRELLNEDLSREYQAIIAYVVYSQVLTGAEYMDIAAQLEIHAKQELDHALIIARQIDYLGKMPAVTPKPVRTSKKPKDMLRFDLDNENETIRNYRDRIRQCEALGEFAMAEQIRQILIQEQDHQIDLATALGIDVPDVSRGPQRRAVSKRR